MLIRVIPEGYGNISLSYIKRCLAWCCITRQQILLVVLVDTYICIIRYFNFNQLASQPVRQLNKITIYCTRHTRPVNPHIMVGFYTENSQWNNCVNNTRKTLDTYSSINKYRHIHQPKDWSITRKSLLTYIRTHNNAFGLTYRH